MNKKIFAFFIIFQFSFSALFSQAVENPLPLEEELHSEEENTQIPENSNETAGQEESDLFIEKEKLLSSDIKDSLDNLPYPESFIEDTTKHEIDFFLNYGPLLIFRTIDSNTSTPNHSASFPFSIGLVFPAEMTFNFQPLVSFYSAYYIWDGENAFPSSQEESTNTAFCLLVDLPAYFSYSFLNNHYFECGTGPVIKARIAKNLNGLEENIPTEEINYWFWTNANFFFWSFSADCLYCFKNGIKGGPEFRFYLPLGSLFSGNGFNGFCMNMGIKIRY